MKRLITLTVNSTPYEVAIEPRQSLLQLLREELRKAKDRLGADSQRRIETNPLRVLDSKLEHEQPIIAQPAPCRRDSTSRRSRI